MKGIENVYLTLLGIYDDTNNRDKIVEKYMRQAYLCTKRSSNWIRFTGEKNHLWNITNTY